MENKGLAQPEISIGQNPTGMPSGQPMNYSQPMNYGQPMVGYAQQPPPGMSMQSQSNVMVVNTQPQAQNVLRVIDNLQGHRQWTSGLFDCTDDMNSCLFTCFCYSCALCYMSERIGEKFCYPCCSPATEIFLRTRIRSIGGIQGDMIEDCCITSFCGQCAACQEARELTAMGIQP